MKNLETFLLPFVLVMSSLGLAQSTGIQPTEAMNGEVALDTLNIHLEIPLVNKAGIGLPVSLKMTYNSNFWNWTLVGGVGTQWVPPTTFWRMPASSSDTFVGQLLSAGAFQCQDVKPYVYRLSYWGYMDPGGNVHAFHSTVVPNTQLESGQPSEGDDGRGHYHVL